MDNFVSGSIAVCVKNAPDNGAGALKHVIGHCYFLKDEDLEFYNDPKNRAFFVNRISKEYYDFILNSCHFDK